MWKYNKHGIELDMQTKSNKRHDYKPFMQVDMDYWEDSLLALKEFIAS